MKFKFKYIVTGAKFFSYATTIFILTASLFVALIGYAFTMPPINLATVASPDGKYDAILMEFPAPAFASTNYTLYIVPKGEKYARKYIKMTAHHLDEQTKIKWLNTNEIQIEYSKGHINSFDDCALQNHETGLYEIKLRLIYTGDFNKERANVLYYASGYYASIKDDQKRVQLLQKATDLGHAAAANDLGVLYSQGKVVEKNLTKATALYQQAAANGDELAMYNLGLDELRKTSPNYSVAANWFEKSIKTKPGVCPLNDLGLLYAKGVGVEKNSEKAKQLIYQAALSFLKENKQLLLSKLTKTISSSGVALNEEYAHAFTEYQYALHTKGDTESIEKDYSPHVLSLVKILSQELIDTCQQEVPPIFQMRK